MGEKSGKFLGGFILGTIVGSTLGVLLGSKLNQVLGADAEPDIANTDEVSVQTRQNLEQKIAQLNAAIDAISRELGTSEGLDGKT